MKHLIQATRPKTLLTGIAPLLLTVGVLKSNGLGLDYPLYFLTVLCVVLLQMGTNLVNDYYDGVRGIDTQERLGPERFSGSDSKKAREIKLSFIFAFILALTIGLYISFNTGIEVLILGILSLFVAYAYTGGPYPLSYYALGEFFAFLFFGPVAAIGSYYIQDKTIGLNIMVASLGPGLFSSALMAINNYRDMKTDKKTKKITLALIIGKKWTKHMIGFFLLAPFLINIFISVTHKQIIHLLPLLTLVLVFINIKKVFKNEITSEINKTLGLTSLINFIWCTLTALIFYIG